MKPALAQISSLNSPLADDVADYAAGQCRAIELWLTKVETYLQSNSLEQLRALFDEHQMQTPVASYQGGLLLSQGEQRQQTWEHFQQRLALCQSLSVETLVVAGDLIGPIDQTGLERATMSLRQAAEAAEQHNVRLAFEFQAQAAFANNLESALALLQQVDAKNLGICLDLFHYYTGPSKAEDLQHLTAENLFHVQFCDLADVARELATDADRILPGDGDFQLDPIVEVLRQIGYRGYVSVELMNPQIWQIPALQFGEIAMTALRSALGQAEMGAA